MEIFERALTGLADDAGSLAITLFVVGVVCYFIEKLRPAQPGTKFFKKDFRKEFSLAILNALLVIPVLSFALSISIVAVMKNFMPYQAFDETLGAWPLALQILLGLVIMDFSTYWRHRFTHNYMWPYHSIHHSAEEITWITSLRLHPVDCAVALLFDTVILYFMGFDGQGIAAAAVIGQVYNYFTHANLNVRFARPLCYILASPHYHRWHHATDKAAYDKNFCAIFSFLDVIFGTYYHPDDLPPAYGLSPRDQKDVPPRLFAHIFQPIKKDFLKFFGKKS
ncbi:MAG: sterol desaturase family protein [Alphaproteobacteria bacterium]